jgi:Tfp pilus assembly protein PilF
MKLPAKIMLLVLATLTLSTASWAKTVEPNAEAIRLAAEAQTAMASGDTKAAVNLMEKAIQADPTNAALYSQYGTMLSVRIGQVTFMAQGMIAGKMLRAYKKSVELDPNHMAGYIGLCRYYLNAPAIAGGNVNKAETYAREVHARVAWLGSMELALVAEKRGDMEKAAELFRTALKGNPQHRGAIAGLKRVTATTTDKE